MLNSRGYLPSGHQMWKIHDWWMIFHGNDSQRRISWPFITMNHYWPPIYYPLSTNILSIINQYTIHYQPLLSILNHYQPFLTRGYQPFSWPREMIRMIPTIITGSMVTSLEFCTCKLMTCHGGTWCFWSPKRCRHVIYHDFKEILLGYFRFGSLRFLGMFPICLFLKLTISLFCLGAVRILMYNFPILLETWQTDQRSLAQYT